MISKFAEIQFHQDAAITYYLIYDRPIVKNALAISDITDGAQKLLQGHYDPNDKTGSFLNAIIPGAISALIGGWFGPMIGLTLRMSNIDIAAILREIYDKLKTILSSGKQQLSSEQINDTVQTAVQNNTGENIKTSSLSFDQKIKEAKMMKLGMLSLVNRTIPEQQLKQIFAAGRGGKAAILSTVLSLIFKTIAYAAGLMVVGDVVNKALGRPNVIDDKNKSGIPTEETKNDISRSQQKIFPLNKSYQEETYNQGSNWIEKVSNDQSSIENMFISFSKEVYDGLNGLEDKIKSSPHFRALVQSFLSYNHMSAGDPIVFIPKMFHSKKDIVDHFIDDVAKITKSTDKKQSLIPPISPKTDFPPSKSPFDGIPRRNLA